MKKFQIMAFAIAVSAVGFTACLDDDDDTTSFEPYVQGYVMQHDGADGSRTFEPYIVVSSNSQDYKITNVEMFSSTNTLQMEKLDDYMYQTVEGQNYGSIQALAGTYSVVAQTAAGLRYNTSINFSMAPSDTMGIAKINEFSYDGTTMRVKMPYVHNAAIYGCAILPYTDEIAPKRVNTTYCTATYPSLSADSVVSFTITLYSNQTAADKMLVKTYCSGTTGMYVESDSTIYVDLKKL